VLGDVVVPERAEDAITPISPDYDHPSSVAEQLRWLTAAGFSASPSWVRGDLAVIVARIVHRRT
jgi:tRNA (cmo5U34)-methyltransferase